MAMSCGCQADPRGLGGFTLTLSPCQRAGVQRRCRRDGARSLPASLALAGSTHGWACGCVVLALPSSHPSSRVPSVSLTPATRFTAPLRDQDEAVISGPYVTSAEAAPTPGHTRR